MYICECVCVFETDLPFPLVSFPVLKRSKLTAGLFLVTDPYSSDSDLVDLLEDEPPVDTPIPEVD